LERNKLIVEEYSHIFHKSVYEIKDEVGPEIGQKMGMVFFLQPISSSELEED
jgi:hypothetical protein